MHFDAREFRAAQQAADASIALQPFFWNLMMKTQLALYWHGDLDAARAMLDRLPREVFREDHGVAVALEVHRLRRDGQAMLGLLENTAREWIGGWEAGPKAGYAALAYEFLGREQAAAVERTAALRIVERRLAETPNAADLLFWKGWLLAAQGNVAEASQIFRLLEQMRGKRDMFTLAGWVLLKRFDEAMEILEAWENNPPDSSFTAAFIRHYWLYDALRALARFQALQARLDANPRFSPQAKTTADKSVAVLAFANLSDDKANEYFSDGVSEELLTLLQKISGLKVTAQASAWSFKGKSATTQEIGEKLGVAHVVGGSVQKSGNRVRITARLSRAATNEELWSQSFGPLELTDVFATQSEIAQAIVAELRGRLGGNAPASAEIVAQVTAAEIGGTRNVEAHQLFLRGRFSANQGTPESLLLAQTLLERAVALDENFARAWVALSNAGWLRQGYEMNLQKAAEGAALALRAANRALTLAPNFAPAHVARLNVQFFAYDWKGAAESLRRATELAPNDPGVMCGAMLLANTLGQTERAVDFSRQAAALDPVNPVVLGFCGFTLMGARRFAEAEAMFRRVAELNGSAPWGHSGVGLNFVAQGRFEEAAAAAALVGVEWERLIVLALANWGQGKKVEADAALAGLAGRFADFIAYQVAEVHAFRGETDRAFEWLERADRQHDVALAWIKLDVFLPNLHADPRWPVFLRKLGLADDQLK